MPSRSNSRATSQARDAVLQLLKDDHKRVQAAYREFNKLDRDEDSARCEAIVQQVLADLELHATLEEELLDPAARDAIKEPDLIDEAEVVAAAAGTDSERGSPRRASGKTTGSARASAGDGEGMAPGQAMTSRKL